MRPLRSCSAMSASSNGERDRHQIIGACALVEFMDLGRHAPRRKRCRSRPRNRPASARHNASSACASCRGWLGVSNTDRACGQKTRRRGCSQRPACSRHRARQAAARHRFRSCRPAASLTKGAQDCTPRKIGDGDRPLSGLAAPRNTRRRTLAGESRLADRHPGVGMGDNDEHLQRLPSSRGDGGGVFLQACGMFAVSAPRREGHVSETSTNAERQRLPAPVGHKSGHDARRACDQEQGRHQRRAWPSHSFEVRPRDLAHRGRVERLAPWPPCTRYAPEARASRVMVRAIGGAVGVSGARRSARSS